MPNPTLASQDHQNNIQEDILILYRQDARLLETNESQINEIKALISSFQMDMRGFADTVNQSLNGLHQEMNGFRQEMNGFRQSMNEFNQRLNESRNAKSQIRGDIQALRDQVTVLQQSLPPP
jgi:uncharacterized coiled-coil DUF342 family protein